MATFGRKITGNDVGFGYTNSGQARGSIMGTVPGPSWLIEFGGRVGKQTSTNTTGQFAAYAYSGSTVTTLLVASNQFTLDTLMADSYSGRDFLATPAAPYKLASGQATSLHFLTPSGYGAFGQDNSGHLMHDRSGISSFPSSYGGTSSAQGKMALWIEYQVNRAPKIPTGITLNGVALGAGTHVTADTTPLVHGLFRDDDEELYVGTRLVWGVGSADKIAGYQVVFARVSDGGWQYDSGYVGANSTDQSQRDFDHQCTAIVPGAYTVYTRVWDQHGAVSDWSSNPVTIASATVETTGNPTGKQTTLTPTSFAFKFVNSTADSATNVQLQLYQNGVLIGTSPEIAKTVAANATSTITWAETGFGSLSWGTNYSYKVRAKYVGIWTDYSNERTFYTNAAPSKPTGLSPNGGAFASLPTLSATMADPDDATSALTVSWEITQPNATVVTMSGGTTSGNIRMIATTATQVSAQGTYSWRVQTTDPTGLQSPWSDYASFAFGSYPAVAITAVTPGTTSAITSSNPTIDWTVGGSHSPTSTAQTAYVVNVYEAGTNNLKWTSSRQVSQATIHQVTGIFLLNTKQYEVEVIVENNVGLSGSSGRTLFTIALVPPASLASFSVQARTLQGDLTGRPSGVELIWTPSSVTASTFLRYELIRESSKGAIKLLEIASQPVGYWVDPVPPTGEDVTYRIRQVITSGADELPSGYMSGSVRVDSSALTLTDVVEGASRHAVFPIVTSIEEKPMTDEAVVQTWEELPTSLVGTLEATSYSISAKIRDYPGQTVSALVQKQAVRELFRKRLDANGRKYPRILCLRDQTNRYHFGRASNLRMRDGALLGQADIQFDFIEVSFKLGEEVV